MIMLLSILFIIGLGSQAVLYAYWIVGMRPNSLLVWAVLTLTGICVALMVVLALKSQNMQARWLSVGLIGVVTLAFSALWIVSLGLLTAPIAFTLIALSIVMLIRNRRAGFSWKQTEPLQ